VRVKSALFFLLAILLLSACNLGKAPEPTAAAPTDSPVTPAPTLPPTASSPLAVLLMPADMDKATSDAYQTAVYDLTQQSGMRFQVRNAMTPQDMDPGLKVVVALPPDPASPPWPRPLHRCSSSPSTSPA
jgi:hypothetical protein